MVTQLTPEQQAKVNAWKGQSTADRVATAKVAPPNPTPTPSTGTSSLPPLNTAGTPVDTVKEQQTIKNLGFTPKTDQDVLNMAIMTYGTDLPDQYKALQTKLESLSGTNDVANQGALQALGGDISKYGQSATDYQSLAEQQKGQIPLQLNALQTAMKIKSGVGAQPLGTSDIFAQAGVTGYGALAASMAAHRDEMDTKYNNYANWFSQIANAQYATNAADIAKADAALKNFSILRDSYQYEQGRLDDIAARAEDWAHTLEGYKLQHQYSLDEVAYKAGLESSSSLLPSFDSSGNLQMGGYSSYVDSLGNYILPSGESTAQGERVTLGTKGDGSPGSEFADNCVKYLRTLVPNLPYGLWDKTDKMAAIQSVGSTNIDEIQAGDGILTYEGAYGHGAEVALRDGNKIYLREANYKPGTITEGRVLDLSNPTDRAKIMGYIRPDGSNANPTVPTPSKGWLGTANLVNQGMDPVKIMANNYEGMNPQGAESYSPTKVYSDKDLWDAYSNAFASAYPDSASITSSGHSKLEDAKTSFLSNYLATGDYGNAKTQILNLAINALGTTEGTKVRDRLAVIEGLVEIKELIGAIPANKLSYLGGNVEKTIQKLGTTTDPQLLDLAERLAVLQDNYSRAQTGAAITDTEQAFYSNLFPQITGTKQFDSSKLDSLMNGLNQTNASVVGNVMGKNYYEKLFSPSTLDSERGWDEETASATQQAMQNIFNINL